MPVKSRHHAKLTDRISGELSGRGVISTANETDRKSDDRLIENSEPSCRKSIQSLDFRQLDSVSARISDVDRITRPFAVNPRVIDFDSLDFQLFDQLLRITRPFNVKRVM